MPSGSPKAEKKRHLPRPDTRPGGPHRHADAASPGVTLIGCGNWGSALALALHQAGVPLKEIVVQEKQTASRTSHFRERRIAGAVGARLTTLDRAALDVGILWICTADASIAEVAGRLTHALGRIHHARPSVVFHSSGALSSEELAELRTTGASVASVHPLMTFPRPSSPRSRRHFGPPHLTLAGVPFAIEGDTRARTVARKLIRTMGAEAFPLPAEHKALYHAYGAFASPLLVALLTATMEAGVAAGFSTRQARRRMQRIVEQTVRNFFADGPEKSFSGPIARGDTATVARHLQALRPQPELQAIYRQLARFAAASLPTRNRRAIEQRLTRTF